MSSEAVDNKESCCGDLYTINLKAFDECGEHVEQVIVNSGYCQPEVNLKPQRAVAPNGSGVGNQCLVCNKTFRSSASLIIHLRFHTGERPYSCPRCNKAFCSLSSLTNHSRRHDASTRIYKCTLCPRSFIYPRELIRHTRIHTGARPFVCMVCSKGFTQEGDLVKHNRVHTGERPYLCSDISCGRAFPSSSNLRAHMRHVHNAGSIERRHSCTVCEKKFIMATHLRAHMRTHSCERAHTCTLCGKAFREAGTLRRHMTIHSGVRPYKCSECDKCFPIANNLKKHMRVHTGERPYSCTICQKSFSSGSNLKTHLKSHTGEKQHKCESCDRLFTLSSHLKAHRKTHNKSETYPCTYCDKSYTASASLRRHIAMHRGQGTDATCNKNNDDARHDTAIRNMLPLPNIGPASIAGSLSSGKLIATQHMAALNTNIATTQHVTELNSNQQWDSEQTVSHCNHDPVQENNTIHKNNIMYENNTVHENDILFDCRSKSCGVTGEPSIELESPPVQQQSMNYTPLTNYQIVHTEPGGNETYLYQPYAAQQLNLQQMNKVIFCQGENVNGNCQVMDVGDYVYTASAMQQQTNIVNNEHKRLHCVFCNKTFVSEEVLGLHLRSHATDNHFTCSQCSTTFTEESSLRRHTKVHQ